MAVPVLQFERVSKRYGLGELAPYSTLRDAIAQRLLRKGPEPESGELWALDDVSFEIGEGEAVGIVGRNGAGKTTLLRIAAKITTPTAGIARSRGRVGALLEVGTGFHPELTGRENVLINGVILGLSRAEVRARFDEIVDFAAVERFLDTPLKRWSSGMQLRLAFAVAAHLTPSVLAVDEVLAVGDAEFQRRCLGRLSEVHNEGRTVLFVSHDLGAVARLCQRAIWIDRGGVRADGPSGEIIQRYLAEAFGAQREARIELAGRSAGPLRLESLAVADGDGGSPPLRGLDLEIRLAFEVVEPAAELDVAFWVADADGLRIIDDAWSDHRELPVRMEPGERLELTATLPPLLRPGDYVLGAWIGTEGTWVKYLDEELGRFTVEAHPEDRDEVVKRRRAVMPPVGWSLSERS